MTDIDRKIDLTKEAIKKWTQLIQLYMNASERRQIPSAFENESMEILTWLQKNYSAIGREVISVVRREYFDPMTGVHIKGYDPVLNLIMTVGSLSELFSHPLRKEFEDNLRSGRNALNAYLGFLEERKRKVGEINVNDYEKMKAFVDENVKQSERLSEREDLVKRLVLQLKHFDVASNYFEEAKSCFKYGFFRASTIMAISSLESCLKTDYQEIKHEEYEGKLIDLLNRYFSGDIKKLPKQYEDFSKTYVKIRNSFTHPEEFNYSENIVFNVLCTVVELMTAIEKRC